MQVFLKKHGPGPAAHALKISWSRSGRKIRMDFTVSKRNSSSWLSNPEMSFDYQKNWGLWNTDVVEAFFQLRNHENDLTAPYLEIQVSPMNHPLALVIIEPRKTFHAPESLHFSTQSEVNQRVWTGSMDVTLPPELKGNLLYGGFFSCLTTDPREYYALEPNPEANADFHRPELFLSLDHE